MEIFLEIGKERMLIVTNAECVPFEQMLGINAINVISLGLDTADSERINCVRYLCCCREFVRVDITDNIVLLLTARTLFLFREFKYTGKLR